MLGVNDQADRTCTMYASALALATGWPFSLSRRNQDM